MCLKGHHNEIPANLSTVDKFWEWPRYPEYRNSFSYLIMKAIEQSDEIKRGVLEEEDKGTIDNYKWETLKRMTNKHEVFDNFDKWFIDERSRDDFIIPEHNVIHFIVRTFRPFFDKLNGDLNNNNDLDTFAKGILNGLYDSHWNEARERLNDTLLHIHSEEDIARILKQIFLANDTSK